MWERSWELQHRIERWYARLLSRAKKSTPSPRIVQTVSLISGLAIMFYAMWTIWPHQFYNQYDAIVKLSMVFFGLLLFIRGAMMEVEDDGEDRPEGETE